MSSGEETRKIQFTGKSTYIISLPKKWITDLGLKQGDQVSVGRKGISSLHVTPYNTRKKDQTDTATIEIEPKEETSTVVRKLVSLYFLHFKTISIKPRVGRIMQSQRIGIRNDVKKILMGAEITASVELTNAIEASETGTAVTGTAVTGTTVTGPSGESFYKLGAGQIEYDMTCNATPGFFANADDDSIVIYLNPTDDGIITITLHEELIKPFEDGTFVVIVDNQEMQDFTQVGNTLTIPCMVGTEKIEIHGSWAIPEFGVIAAMILAVAIVSIIVVTAKTKLSIVPRY